jgi:hypothetical protein
VKNLSSASRREMYPMDPMIGDSEAAEPDPTWKWLLVMFIAGLANAASSDIWSFIKIVAKCAISSD